MNERRPALAETRDFVFKLRDFPTALHTALKIRAAQERCTMQEIIERAIRHELNTIGKEGRL